MKKIKLKSLLFEEASQAIPTNVVPQMTQQPQNYSLDQKIDKFIIQYERESNPDAAMFPDDSGLSQAVATHSGTQGVGAGFGGGQAAAPTPVSLKGGLAENKKNKLRIKDILWEQDEQSLDTDPAALTDPASGLGGDLGGTDPAPTATDIQIPKPQINLSVFANKVARLIDNFESLVNPKVILLNRVYTYIRQYYDENTAKELLIILESNYNISNETLTNKKNDLTNQIPFAVVGVDGGGVGG